MATRVQYQDWDTVSDKLYELDIKTERLAAAGPPLTPEPVKVPDTSSGRNRPLPIPPGS